MGYASKKSAVRAAKAAGVPAESINVVQHVDKTYSVYDGRSGLPVGQASEPPAEPPAAAVEVAAPPQDAPEAPAAPAAAEAAAPEATPVPVAVIEAGTSRPRKATVAAFEAADRGELPAEPNFSAATHAGFRKGLAAVTKAATEGDIAALLALRDGERGVRVPKGDPSLDRYLATCIRAVQARLATVAA